MPAKAAGSPRTDRANTSLWMDIAVEAITHRIDTPKAGRRTHDFIGSRATGSASDIVRSFRADPGFASRSGCAVPALISESVVQPELHRPRSDSVIRIILARDSRETRIVHILITQIKIRVIEHIEEVRVQLQVLPLRNLEVFHYREVVVAELRSIECAFLQRTLRPRLWIEKELSLKGRRSVCRDPASVRADMRRIKPVGSISRHEQARELMQLLQRGDGADSVLPLTDSPINITPHRDHQDRPPRLNYRKPGQRP